MKQTPRLVVTLLALLSLSVGMQAQKSRHDTLRDSILSNITGAKIPQLTVRLTDFGARGDGQGDCSAAFHKAFQRLARSGGGTVVVPQGVWMHRGPLTLQSNTAVRLERGAILRFSTLPDDYPTVATSWEGTFLYNHSPLIYGYGLHDVAITGEGIVDGNAQSVFNTWTDFQDDDQRLSRDMNHQETDVSRRVFGPGHFLRPQLMQFYKCRGVTVEGVKMVNSPFWCVHLLQSENVVCRALRYDVQGANNDGIDPESSRNVLIEDVRFNNSDDNVAIKSGRDNDGWRLAGPSENIVVRRCHFKGHHSMVIGSEMSGGVHNVVVEDCTYDGRCNTGVYIKTNPDRGGFVENIYVRNCEFGTVEDLFYVSNHYGFQGIGNNHFARISNIVIDSLRCTEARGAAIVVQGSAEEPVRGVSLSHVEAGQAATGISLDYAEGVTLSDCHVGPRAAMPVKGIKRAPGQRMK